ncbi:MAG: DUF6597 domain-containing transcriptional factor [Thermoanaerobaculia bacterium]
MASESTLRYREQAPSARWRPFIECFWEVVDPVPREDRAPEHVVPDGCPELIVHFAVPFARRVGARSFRLPQPQVRKRSPTSRAQRRSPICNGWPEAGAASGTA